jgi:hypothetical protein
VLVARKSLSHDLFMAKNDNAELAELLRANIEASNRTTHAVRAIVRFVFLQLTITTVSPGYSLTVQAIYAFILVLAIYLIDHPKLLPAAKTKRMNIAVDFVETDQAALLAKVHEILGKKVLQVETRSIVVTPPSMKLDVKYSER